MTLLARLASALKRVEPYLDLLPPTAAQEVRDALEAIRKLKESEK